MNAFKGIANLKTSLSYAAGGIETLGSLKG
jgi:hypothetical protein